MDSLAHVPRPGTMQLCSVLPAEPQLRTQPYPSYLTHIRIGPPAMSFDGGGGGVRSRTWACFTIPPLPEVGPTREKNEPRSEHTDTEPSPRLQCQSHQLTFLACASCRCTHQSASNGRMQACARHCLGETCVIAHLTAARWFKIFSSKGVV